MIFRPYYYFDLGCAAYLFGCGTVGKGTVVDARADDVEAYITFAAAKGLRLTHVIDTHVHADHRSGGPELARRTGAQYCVHESADVTFVFTASLHDKLLTLPDDLEIYPGHFSGSVCGIGLSGKPTSTLAFEKRWNSMLSLNRHEFIEALSDVPPKPAEMERVLAFNRGTEAAGTSA